MGSLSKVVDETVARLLAAAQLGRRPPLLASRYEKRLIGIIIK